MGGGGGAAAGRRVGVGHGCRFCGKVMCVPWLYVRVVAVALVLLVGLERLFDMWSNIDGTEDQVAC